VKREQGHDAVLTSSFVELGSRSGTAASSSPSYVVWDEEFAGEGCLATR
jgi:hypothetical protein